jgi:hypothetical protein
MFLLDIVNRKNLALRVLPQVHLWRHKDIEFKTFHKKQSLPMKQLLSVFAFLLFGAFVANAQSGPTMTFKITTVDYGKIEKGSDKVRKFEFTNTGSEPLIIKSAKGSCGCTVPTYPQEPIMPGETKTIDVSYDTNRVGAFTKTVTITTNETPDSHTLTIKGEVLNPPTQESVPASGGGINKQ